MRWLLSRGLALSLLVGTAAGFLQGDPGKEAARIAALIKQLGDDRFVNREAASRALEALGEPALPALRKAAVESEELETRQRAGRLVTTILLGARKSRSIGLEMVLLDAGEFEMGSPNKETGRRADEAAHTVRITRPFLLGAYEVTQDEYQQVMKITPSWFSRTGGGKDKLPAGDTGRFPVERVTWYDAVEFCNRLSERDGYPPYYKLAEVQREDGAIRSAHVTIAGGSGYRLPTEAEWEYACRAGTNSRFHFGASGGDGNFKAVTSTAYGITSERPSLGRTTRVGSYKPNHRGLYDMHGNVAEWCWDWYDRDYYSNSPQADPQGPAQGTHRVSRGGSWLVGESSCRSASRGFHVPDYADYHGGFRIARTP